MKFLKTFEDLQSEIETDDYVLIHLDDDYDNDFVEFINNNIGQVINIDYRNNITIDYDHVPWKLGKWFIRGVDGEFLRTFGINQVAEFSESKDELEMKLDVNKYNL